MFLYWREIEKSPIIFGFSDHSSLLSVILLLRGFADSIIRLLFAVVKIETVVMWYLLFFFVVVFLIDDIKQFLQQKKKTILVYITAKITRDLFIVPVS